MSEYVAHLKELFEEFGDVDLRRMFGGYGVFYDGLMIGLVADEELYLKTDPETVPLFEARGLEAFQYNKKGKQVKMSYSRAPEEVLEETSEMVIWADLAYSAALRSKKNK